MGIRYKDLTKTWWVVNNVNGELKRNHSTFIILTIFWKNGLWRDWNSRFLISQSNTRFRHSMPKPLFWKIWSQTKTNSESAKSTFFRIGSNQAHPLNLSKQEAFYQCCIWGKMYFLDLDPVKEHNNGCLVAVKQVADFPAFDLAPWCPYQECEPWC